MSKKSMNMILANWVHSRVCESCRETGAGPEFAQHDDCKNHLSVINWLLGGQTGDRELQGCASGCDSEVVGSSSGER